MTTMRRADALPQLTCVGCGSPADGFEHQPGYVARFDGVGPFGGPGHVVGTLDEIHDSRPATYTPAQISPAPDFQKVTVQPCGCVLLHADAAAMLDRVRTVMADIRRREAEATLDRHVDLLAACEAAGHGVLVERYRQAVHDRSGDQQGLLVALRTLTTSM